MLTVNRTELEWVGCRSYTANQARKLFNFPDKTDEWHLSIILMGCFLNLFVRNSTCYGFLMKKKPEGPEHVTRLKDTHLRELGLGVQELRHSAD